MEADPRTRDAGGPTWQPLGGATWAERRDAVLTILGWMAMAAAAYWLASRVIQALLMLVIAALVAFALYPVVDVLSRHMPRQAAILAVYLGLLSALMALGYLVVTAAAQEFAALVEEGRALVAPGPNGAPPPLINWLSGLGVSQATLSSLDQQVVALAQNLAGSALAIVGTAFALALDTILTSILSIYLLLDGDRVLGWLRRHVPLTYRPRVDLALGTLERVFGGYVRSQLLISSLAGILYGGGMFVLQVPYAILLGVLAFVLQFIPFIGPLVSIAACVSVAFTQGPGRGIAALIVVLIIRIFMDDILGPRISGHGVGLHPAIAILAVIAGTEVYGFWGALFSAPVAGVLQAFIRYLYIAYRDRHIELFPEEEAAVEEIAAVAVVIETSTDLDPTAAPSLTIESVAQAPELGEQVSPGNGTTPGALPPRTPQGPEGPGPRRKNGERWRLWLMGRRGIRVSR